MISMKVSHVIRECQGKLVCGDENLVLQHFSNDTRTIQEGDVYLGIRGENFDGNSFYVEALSKGASCCILDSFIEEELPEEYRDRTIILVKDTVLALQQLATYKRNQLSIPVVAVTGSAGKTSTKDMIAEVLRQKYSVFKTPGNLNGQIGLPLSILELQEEEVLVLEMGMNDFGQISKLSYIAKPTIAVITNIGTAHIGILGSKENILKAKLEILEGMKEHSPLIINGDDVLLSNLELSNHPIITCSMEFPNSNYYLSNISLAQEFSQFQVHYNTEQFELQIPIFGKAFLMDSLLAVAVGKQLEVPSSLIQTSLRHFQLSGNRMEVLKCHGVTILNDTYNSNYEALVNAFEVLKNYEGTRKIAVLGDVLELNQYAKKIHYEIGQIPDLKQVNFLFLSGENAKSIQEGALDSGILEQQIFYFEDKEVLTKELLSFLQVGDVVLIKASHGMQFETITQKIKESYLV